MVPLATGLPVPKICAPPSSALEAGGVHLVDVPVVYSENRRVFDEELAELTCRL